MTSHITNAMLLAGSAFLLILTGAIALCARCSARRDRELCNYRADGVYREMNTSTEHDDLYRMYIVLQQRINVLEDDYYRRLAQQRQARKNLINSTLPTPVPGVPRGRRTNLDDRASTN